MRSSSLGMRWSILYEELLKVFFIVENKGVEIDYKIIKVIIKKNVC